MAEEGWELEASFASFDEAIDHGTSLAGETGHAVKVVRDPEYDQPWQVWVQ